MTVQELIDLLVDLDDKDAEVRLAIQQHYPLEGKVLGVATSEQVQAKMEHKDSSLDSPKLYIAIDTADEYSHSEVWEVAMENADGY